jgi:cyclopropane-fatty-acyl-phospholipid synthase
MIKIGTLSIINADGKIYQFTGRESSLKSKNICVQFHDDFYASFLALSPSMALGEGYMNNRLSILNGTIYDFLEILAVNVEKNNYHWLHKIFKSLDTFKKRIHQFNIKQISRKNVAHHYDLSGELYKLFLDEDRQYSCVYFSDEVSCLNTAQMDKKDHISAKLLLKKNCKVLDIGSGWGRMELHIAQKFGANVRGVTLSQEQLEESQRRAAENNLEDLVKFDLLDYRMIDGQFDRIVSVGMFEHVGINYFNQFFKKIHDNLASDGIALIHTIGRIGPPSVTDPWIRKYIFPGGYIPSLSEITPAIEKSGLIATDIEFLGQHYAETLNHWQQYFQSNRVTVGRIYDESFCRMWEYYLACSEIAFRYLDLTVFQIQLAKEGTNVPMTRDYMTTKNANVMNASKKHPQFA